MSQLVLNIHNENILSKLLWMLEHFKDDGVEVKEIHRDTKEYDLEYENSFEYKLDKAEFKEQKGNF